jgi:hypothetical protein
MQTRREGIAKALELARQHKLGRVEVNNYQIQIIANEDGSIVWNSEPRQ